MFCPNDKALLKPVAGVLTCPKCNWQKTGKAQSVVVKGAAVEKEQVIVDVEKDKISQLPTASYFCEKCGHDTAYYFFRQTRSADEATTRFLECTKCGYKWREYR
ncbi:MAG TPA: transcription factor S [Candidatus Thermoplasmatota archaeon]|nr:transcription factor S [Candidatus Thermoplasmatota archaeon]